MATNGHTPSSRDIFPRLHLANGHSSASRIPITASAKPSAVRPAGLGDADIPSPGVSSSSGGAGAGERPAVRGWQDKAALTGGSEASPQPGPVTNGVRSGLLDTAGVRTQNSPLGREKKVHTSIWMQPKVKLALQQIASQDDISFSETCDTGLEVYARAKIHDQEETLFEPRMQAMLRREIRASDNRHVPFEIKNAIASEQTRILIADLYKRQLLQEGVPLKKIEAKLDAAYHLARSNVLNTKTPKFKNLLAQWWQTTEDLPDRQAGQASDRQDQAKGRQDRKTGEGEAGTDTTTS